ncbi:hypothetical protein PCANC_18561 [Puccinia coronata f. sp. avenae]|uniref:Uncharacterized protein n=1 Tax=Puccinia coronata f. sp. avenae TaxID=200324 RepID=A0A2N5STA2_9BASI|nr:hypothetical protein PCANC_18561 [Puccinia coronata f. sp. avenae]PLW50316.1 hypothetical protein PCASD_01644 [Puccinia coronata f. sp. avenae]
MLGYNRCMVMDVIGIIEGVDTIPREVCKKLMKGELDDKRKHVSLALEPEGYPGLHPFRNPPAGYTRHSGTQKRPPERYPRVAGTGSGYFLYWKSATGHGYTRVNECTPPGQTAVRPTSSGSVGLTSGIGLVTADGLASTPNPRQSAVGNIAHGGPTSVLPTDGTQREKQNGQWLEPSTFWYSPVGDLTMIP